MCGVSLSVCGLFSLFYCFVGVICVGVRRLWFRVMLEVLCLGVDCFRALCFVVVWCYLFVVCFP